MAFSYDADAHIYRTPHQRLPGSTDVIKAEGLVESDWMSEDARWRGQVVHHGIRLLNEGVLDWETVDPALAGYIRSYEHFLKGTGFKILGYEEPMMGQGYGVIPDLWGLLNNVTTVVELKTGPVPKWAALQTALQAAAIKLNKRIPIGKRYGLRLMADGSISKLVPFENPMDEFTALGMVWGFNWKMQNGYIRDWT